MNIIDKVKQWFIDRDLENGGRLDKQSLKLSEEFGELCAGYLQKNEQLTKDSIGDCAVVIVGLALLIKEEVDKVFEGLKPVEEVDVMNCFRGLNLNICAILSYSDRRYGGICRYDLASAVDYLKSISNILGYDFEECFELAYQEIKDRKGRWIDGSFVKEEDFHDTKI